MEIPRYQLPTVPDPINPQDIASKAYVDAGSGGGGLSDLEFLRDKQLAGDLIIAGGLTTGIAPNTCYSVIPANGKTFFMVHANVLIQIDNATNSICGLELQNDLTVVDPRNTSVLGLSSLVIDSLGSPGDSLVGDGVKLYRLQKTVGANFVRMSGHMEGWIQDT